MMSTERRKMLSGEMYDPLDPELVTARARARDLCQKLNATREAEEAERRRILRDLFGKGGDTVWMQPPFYCDYGTNIELGERVFFNFNCIVLDVCPVRIGDFTLFGPAVQIYTPLHPFNAAQRRREEFGKPIEIGADVWVGGRASRRVWEADRDWIGCVGRRRSDHSPWRQHRLASRDRSRQRRDAGCPRRSSRCRQSVSSHPHDH